MVDHLSYSSIRRYLECGRSWHYKYIQEETETRNSSLVFGSAIHKAIATHIQGKSLLSAWQEAWQQEATGEIDWNGETPNDLFNLGVRMLSHGDIASTIEGLKPTTIQGNLAIELPVSLMVPGVSIPVVGYVDLVTEDMIPVDIKTSRTSWNQEKADGDLQATLYIAALWQAGFLTLPARFRFIVLTKTKVPKVQVLDTMRDHTHIWQLYNLVNEVHQAIQGGVFLINPFSWQCSEKYCSFWQNCQGGRNGK